MNRFTILLWVFFLSLSCSAQVEPVNSKTSDTQPEKLPKIIILATGGTIAGMGYEDSSTQYKAGEVPVEDLLKAVPEMNKYAHIQTEQIANIGSQDMDIETWLKLSNRINEIFDHNEADGIVITHGTDTMEETAYFLSLTVQSPHPVVMVGAMRPSNALSQDGNRNLRDAVAVAADKRSAEIGVVVAMNESIIPARTVDKVSTTNVDAFNSRNFGPIGSILDGVVYYPRLYKANTAEQFNVKDFGTLPRVDIVYGYVDAEPQIVDFSVKNGALGIVYAGVGNGNFSAAVQSSLVNAVKDGLMVVRSSRIGKGYVTANNEVDDDQLGFIASNDLNPQKARILLMLALTKTQDKNEIREMFLKD